MKAVVRSLPSPVPPERDCSGGGRQELDSSTMRYQRQNDVDARVEECLAQASAMEREKLASRSAAFFCMIVMVGILLFLPPEEGG